MADYACTILNSGRADRQLTGRAFWLKEAAALAREADELVEITERRIAKSPKLAKGLAMLAERRMDEIIESRKAVKRAIDRESRRTY